MIFIVACDIEGGRIEYVAFPSLEEATACYEEAAYVVRNGPDDEQNPIITRSALFGADARNFADGVAMIKCGVAVMLEAEEWD